MTITERNQKLYELRESLNKARAQVAWIEQEIWLTNEKYKNQDRDLYQEMFGTNWYKLVSCPTSWQGGTPAPPNVPTLCL